MQQKIDGLLVPKLRFPEFWDAGEWEEKMLGDCLDYLQPTEYLVTSTNYDDKYKTPVLTAGKTFVLGYTNEIRGVFEKNLPVIIFDDFTTSSKYVDFPFKAKSSAMKILLARDSVNIKFFYELMQLIKYEVGIHGRHWISTFSKLRVTVPTLPEQQKIADCLSSISDQITLEAQKLDTLKVHKKGLMQQLFPAEGETLPKLRFPEFQDSGEWEEKILGSICDYWNGASHEGSVTENGQYYLISLNSIDINGNLKSDMKRLSNTDKSLQKNDLVMVLSDVAYGSFLGLTDIIPNDHFVLNQRMAGLRLKKSISGNVSFLRTFINFNQKYFKKNGQGSSQLNLSKSLPKSK